jgi:hypothetical protein
MERFETRQALAEWCKDHTGPECVVLYNSIPGVKLVSRFENRDVAASRIRKALAQPVVEAKDPLPSAPKPRTPKAVSAAKKPAAKVRTAKAKKGNITGGRRDEVIALLKRKGGATLSELMKTFKWEPHTTRGFMSTLASKHGYAVKSERIDGVRTYSL